MRRPLSTRPGTVRACLAGVVAMLALLPGRGAAALDRSATFRVSAQVQSRCTVEARHVHFGIYIGRRLSATSTWHVRCSTAGTAVAIAYDTGLHATADAQPRLRRVIPPWNRRGSGRSRYLAYSLVEYDATGITDDEGAAAGEATFAILPQQRAIPGLYADVMTVTVTF